LPAYRLTIDGVLGERTVRTVGGVTFPVWVFNDVPVVPAVVPEAGNARVATYFVVEVEGVDHRTTVWAHAADPRTFMPDRIGVPPAVGQPAGIPPTAPLDAFFDIVWAHDAQGRERPVAEAEVVNVGVGVQWHAEFGAGPSVPADFGRPVRLPRALNDGDLEPVKAADAVGTGRRSVASRTSSGTVTWPRWLFNDVGVPAARDPANKYYFAVRVDGAPTHTTVWARGADARTYFPQRDVPARSGVGC
jgi:hypothetical protein